MNYQVIILEGGFKVYADFIEVNSSWLLSSSMPLKKRVIYTRSWRWSSPLFDLIASEISRLLVISQKQGLSNSLGIFLFPLCKRRAFSGVKISKSKFLPQFFLVLFNAICFVSRYMLYIAGYKNSKLYVVYFCLDSNSFI